MNHRMLMLSLALAAVAPLGDASALLSALQPHRKWQRIIRVHPLLDTNPTRARPPPLNSGMQDFSFGYIGKPCVVETQQRMRWDEYLIEISRHRLHQFQVNLRVKGFVNTAHCSYCKWAVGVCIDSARDEQCLQRRQNSECTRGVDLEFAVPTCCIKETRVRMRAIPRRPFTPAPPTPTTTEKPFEPGVPEFKWVPQFEGSRNWGLVPNGGGDGGWGTGTGTTFRPVTFIPETTEFTTFPSVPYDDKHGDSQ